MRTSVLMEARVRACARGCVCVRVCVALCVCQHLAGAGDGRQRVEEGGRKVQLMVSSNGGRRKEQEKPDWACKRRLLKESDGQTSAAALLLCASLPIKSGQRALSTISAPQAPGGKVAERRCWFEKVLV